MFGMVLYVLVVVVMWGECRGVVVVLCVFFFKQKTAYEMRISDWSSDVCSSDLDGAQARHGGFDFGKFGHGPLCNAPDGPATGDLAHAAGHGHFTRSQMFPLPGKML